MADFAVRATAMEEAFGWEPGSFVEVYAANRLQASEALLANEPLADAIKQALHYAERIGESEVCGTATELLNRLGTNVGDETKRSRAWPRGPQVLSRRLRRTGTGVEIHRHRVHRECGGSRQEEGQDPQEARQGR